MKYHYMHIQRFIARIDLLLLNIYVAAKILVMKIVLYVTSNMHFWL